MDIASAIFYLLATLLVIASLMVVFLRNVGPLRHGVGGARCLLIAVFSSRCTRRWSVSYKS